MSAETENGNRSVALTVVEASLQELADIANSEHFQVATAITAALGHAILAGHALNAAAEQIPFGEWQEWLKANFHAHVATGNLYMRFARHEKELLENGITSIRLARPFVRQHALLGREVNRNPRAVSDEERGDMQKLRKSGKTLEEIALLYGVSSSTVWIETTPNGRAMSLASTRASNAKRREAQRALRREKQRDLAKQVGLDHLYEQVRRLCEQTNAAAQAQPPGDARKALSEMYDRLVRAEDALVRAIRVAA